MVNIEAVIKTAAKMGAAQAMIDLGITSGELSQREAIRTYGRWFQQAINNGRIQPCRKGDGKNGTSHYLITDILALKASDQARAEIKL